MTHHPESKGFTVWFTGLSGAGKSTVAEMLYHELQARQMKTEILDGDVVRQNLSKGLGFSKEDRDTNVLRIGFVAELLTRNGVATICCPISPYKETRDQVRAMIGEFVEVYVHATLDELSRNRDPKGLYKKALAGEIKGFTGLSGSGKSTIAEMLYHEFQSRGLKTEILDGDEVRKNLSKGLGFSKEDRDTNILRIGFVANLLTRNGVATICCPISPYKETRDACREQIGEFVEVYVHATVDEIAANRDPKGLYKKALAGEITGFTGVDDPYEVPEHPEITVDTLSQSPEESLQHVLTRLRELGRIDDDSVQVTGDRVHSGLTDLRVSETGTVVKEH